MATPTQSTTPADPENPTPHPSSGAEEIANASSSAQQSAETAEDGAVAWPRTIFPPTMPKKNVS
jgi:hypothetical protein